MAKSPDDDPAESPRPNKPQNPDDADGAEVELPLEEVEDKAT